MCRSLPGGRVSRPADTIEHTRTHTDRLVAGIFESGHSRLIGHVSGRLPTEPVGGSRRRVVALTGASGGIGLATARALCAAGYVVVAGARDVRPLEAAGLGRHLHAVRLDLTDDRSIEHFAAAVSESAGRTAGGVARGAAGGVAGGAEGALADGATRGESGSAEGGAEDAFAGSVAGGAADGVAGSAQVRADQLGVAPIDLAQIFAAQHPAAQVGAAARLILHRCSTAASAFASGSNSATTR